jgi:hypothetical protein
MAKNSNGNPKDKKKQETALPKERKKAGATQSDSQAAKELLLLWAILGEGGGKMVARADLEKKGMLPPDDTHVRGGLAARGLIKVEKGERGRVLMTVTEAGLAWAEKNLAAVPAKLQAAAPILQAWLARLSVLLEVRKIPIGEFLAPHRSGAGSEPCFSPGADSPVLVLHEDSPALTYDPGPSPLNGDYDALRTRIRQAYLDVTGNRVNTRARLRDIRAKLNDVDPSTLESALKRMQREQQATLYPLDNKAEITDADRNAAIYFGSEPRHILWIGR